MLYPYLKVIMAMAVMAVMVVGELVGVGVGVLECGRECRRAVEESQLLKRFIYPCMY